MSKARKQKKDAGGRPTKYEARFCELARRFFLYRPEGTDAELADYLFVSESTVNLWKQKHPRFSESIRAGKLPAAVETNYSLYKLANGYTRKVAKVVDKAVEMVTEEVPPDLGAIRLFMMNRDRSFRDRNDVVLSNPDGSSLGPSLATIQEAQLVAEMLFEKTERERMAKENHANDPGERIAADKPKS